MNIHVHLLSQAKPVMHDDVKNAYTKDGLYCIKTLTTSKIYKYPLVNIFRIIEL